MSSEPPFRLARRRRRPVVRAGPGAVVSALSRAAIPAGARQHHRPGGRAAPARHRPRPLRGPACDRRLPGRSDPRLGALHDRSAHRHDAARHRHHAGRQRPVVRPGGGLLDRAVARRDRGLREPARRHDRHAGRASPDRRHPELSRLRRLSAPVRSGAAGPAAPRRTPRRSSSMSRTSGRSNGSTWPSRPSASSAPHPRPARADRRRAGACRRRAPGGGGRPGARTSSSWASSRTWCRGCRPADVFLLPSAQESFGLAALEAMACEVPVVAFRVGGLPEIIDDGTTGFVCAPQSVAEMAERAIELLTDAPAAHRHGQGRGRRRPDAVLHRPDRAALRGGLSRRPARLNRDWPGCGVSAAATVR